MDARSDPLVLAIKRKARDKARYDANMSARGYEVQPASPAWTDDLLAILKRMWEEGATAGDIAKATGRTRNGVIGKAHRLKLGPSKVPFGAAGQKKPPKKFKEAPKVVKVETVMPSIVADARPPKPGSWDALPGYESVAVPFAQSTGCAWPIGDGYCCNAQPGKRDVYCTAHRRKASYGRAA